MPYVTLYNARCKAIVESSPEDSELPGELQGTHRKLQKMRIRIGKPIKEPSRNPEAVIAENEKTEKEYHQANLFTDHNIGTAFEARNSEVENRTEVIVHCSSDFVTASKKVVMRPRRVRLLGLEVNGCCIVYCICELFEEWCILGQCTILLDHKKN